MNIIVKLYSKLILIFLFSGILSVILFKFIEPFYTKQNNQVKIKNIAKVNNILITMNELEREYYIVTNNFLKNKNKEKKEIIDSIFKRMIKKNLLYSYALDNNIIVSDQEVKENISKYKDFFIDGKFNKDKYLKYIKKYKLSYKDFEENVRKDLYIDKLFKMLEIKNDKILKKLYFGNIYYDIEFKTIPLNKINLKKKEISEKDIFNYWFNNKELFKTKTSYNIIIINKKGFSLEDKRNILEKYNTLLKSKNYKNYQIIENQYLNNLSNKNKKELLKNGITKPIKTKSGFKIIKIVSENKPIYLSYEESHKLVKNKLMSDYIHNQLKHILKISYKNIIFDKEIKKFSFQKRNSLNEKLEKLLKTALINKNDYFIFNNELYFYNIKNKKIVIDKKLNKNDIIEFEIFKKVILEKELLKFLKNKYKIEIYIKFKD